MIRSSIKEPKSGLIYVERYRFMCKPVIILFLLSLFMILQVTEAYAAPITPDLAITGQVTFDTGFALADGSVTQSGNFSRIQGGVSTASSFNGSTVAGANPLMGTLTDIDDGFAMTADVDSLYDSEFAIGIDMEINVNNSAMITYIVSFMVDFSNVVDSDGNDAYADSEFVIYDPISEVFFVDIISDTLNGNEIGGIFTGSYGGLVQDIGTSAFNIIINPSTTATITGAWTLEGGAYEIGSSANADFSAFVSVNIIEPVPEPGTMFLLSLGLIGLASFRRRYKV